MSSKHVCFITWSEEGKGAFGITKDTDQKVYVPLSIADALDLVPFDEIEAITVPNDRADTPLKAIHARMIVRAQEVFAQMPMRTEAVSA